MDRFARRIGCLLLLLGSCKVRDDLYCDPEHPCTDPTRPYCDMEGEYAASGGIGRTCIADPFGADGGEGTVADAAPVDGGNVTGSDAASGRRVVQLSVGIGHSCAVFNDGGLRCWGHGVALGYESTEDVGDNEHPYEAGDVPAGGFVRQVAAGRDFTCALYAEGNVRCWGANRDGQLGYGHTNTVSGPGNTPDMLPDVDLGGAVEQIAAGTFHVCALLTTGDVRCWGLNRTYQLGTGDSEDVGDDESPGSRNPVPIGAPVRSLAAATEHTCALVDGGGVRCWGKLAIGPLGYQGRGPIIGDDETPQDAGDLDVGGEAVEVEAGDDHNCVLLSNGRVRCWGRGQKEDTNFPGVLGYEEDEDIGDDETPGSAGDIALGGTSIELAGLTKARCARLETGDVRCWGRNIAGALGRGSLEDIGDDELPVEVGPVPLGGSIRLLSDGSATHACALLETGGVRCWGANDSGQLGLRSTETIGDDELPIDVAEVRLLE